MPGFYNQETEQQVTIINEQMTTVEQSLIDLEADIAANASDVIAADVPLDLSRGIGAGWALIDAAVGVLTAGLNRVESSLALEPWQFPIPLPRRPERLVVRLKNAANSIASGAMTVSATIQPLGNVAATAVAAVTSAGTGAVQEIALPIPVETDELFPAQIRLYVESGERLLQTYQVLAVWIEED